MVAALMLSAAALGLGLFYLVRQVGHLRVLRPSPAMPTSDLRFLRRQAWRRLATSALLLVLGGMLAGAALGQIDRPIQGLRPAEATDEDRARVRFYVCYWLAMVTLIIVVLTLAVFDLWATQLYGREQLARIRSESRALLERDLALYRQQRMNDRMNKLK